MGLTRTREPIQEAQTVVDGANVMDEKLARAALANAVKAIRQISPAPARTDATRDTRESQSGSE